MNNRNENSPSSSVKKAAALKYDGVNTPKLIAKGDGKLAEQIVSLAEENDVHVHYDPLLLDVLTRLELGDEIPETLYLAVAKIIAFAYYLQGKHPDTKPSQVSQTSLSLEKKIEPMEQSLIAPDQTKSNVK